MAGQKAKWTNILTTTRNQVEENVRVSCTAGATPSVVQATGQFPTITAAGTGAFGGTGNVFTVTFSEKYSAPTAVNLTVVQIAATGSTVAVDAFITTDYSTTTGSLQFALTTGLAGGGITSGTYVVMLDAKFELGR